MSVLLGILEDIGKYVTLIRKIVYRISIIEEYSEVLCGSLHFRKPFDCFVGIGNSRRVAVLGHAPDTLYAFIAFCKCFDLVHVGTVLRHIDCDKLKAERLGYREMAVISGRRAEKFKLFFTAPRTLRADNAVKHCTCKGIIHYVKARVSRNNYIVAGDPRKA